MSHSRTLLRRNKYAAPKRTILKRAARFRRVLGVKTLIAETGAGRHKHAYRYHATKGWLTWRVPFYWEWGGPG